MRVMCWLLNRLGTQIYIEYCLEMYYLNEFYLKLDILMSHNFFLRLIKEFYRHTAGRAASCELQCPTPPSLLYNGAADTRWRCIVRSGL